MACTYCDEAHNPERVSCSTVQARIDGVSVGNPEGTGGLACWAGSSIPLPAAPDTEAESPEWRLW